MSDNLALWNDLKQPPPEFLREIKGGRLAGKTDISPMWRYMAMTNKFGPCGIGWKFVIDRVWAEDASDGQKFAFAQVTVFIKQDGSWSDGIPGQGGSMLIEKESKGPHSSDEGYKMAITDALGTALKIIGVGADVHLGLWDGSKYNNAPANLTNYTHALVKADTLEKLKAIFNELFTDFKNDPEALGTLTRVKDMKKKELEKNEQPQ